MSSWLSVEPLINRRNHLVGLLDKRVEISINGEFQNRTFVDQVQWAVRRELRNQIEDVEARLIALGVSID